MIIRLMFLAVSVLFVGYSPAAAQSYPNRPIEIFVAATAGGMADSIARPLSKALEQDFGKAVVIVNITGGSGAPAVSAFERAAKDGHTLLFWVSSVNALRSMRATAVATVAVQGNIVYGIVTPVGTPDNVVVRLNSAVNKALANSDELKLSLQIFGAEPKPSTPKEAAALMGAGG